MLSYEFQEALWCGIVVSPLIGQILFAHLIHTLVHISHESTDGLTEVFLQEVKIHINQIFTIGSLDQPIPNYVKILQICFVYFLMYNVSHRYEFHFRQETMADRNEGLLWPLVKPVNVGAVHNSRKLATPHSQSGAHRRETQHYLEM